MGGVFSLLMKCLAGLKVALAWQCAVSFPHHSSAQDLSVVGASAVPAQVLAVHWLFATTALGGGTALTAPSLPHTSRSTPWYPFRPTLLPQVPVGHRWGSAIAIIHTMLLKLGFVPALISFCSAWVTAQKTHLTSSATPPLRLLPVCPKVSLWGSSAVPASTICSVPLPWHRHQKAESRPRAFGSLLPPWHARGFS